MIKNLEKILICSGLFLLITKAILGGFLLWQELKNKNETNLDYDGWQQAQELINLTNQYRLDHGLNQLIPNPRLTQAAINKAHDILANNYFNHTSPSGKRFSAWIKEVGYPYLYAGENLAIDFTNTEELFNAWIKSDKHRENIERPNFQEIGIASLTGIFDKKKTNVVVQFFGTRNLTTSELATQEKNYSSNYNNLINNINNNFDNQKIIYQSLIFVNHYLEIMIIIIAILLIILSLLKLISKFSTNHQIKNFNNNQTKIIKAKTKRYQAKINNE